MELHAAIDFTRTTSRSVLTTIRGSGRPQLSNVFHAVGSDDVIRISVTSSRAKYRNLVREPWAALHVTRDDFFAYAVLECDVELAPVVTDTDGASAAEHVEHYRAIVGEHDDWDAYRASLVAEERSLVRLTPTRAYGMLTPPPGVEA